MPSSILRKIEKINEEQKNYDEMLEEKFNKMYRKIK